MREDGFHQFFFGGLQPHSNNEALNKLGHFSTNHMGTEQLAGLLVENGFDHTFRFTQSNGLAVGDEREATNANFEPFFLAGLFGETNRGNLRMAIGTAWNFDLIHRMRLETGNLLNTNGTFMLGFMGQHRRTGNVANRIDAFDIGATIFINDDAATVGFDAKLFKAEILDIALNTNSRNDTVGLDDFSLAALFLDGSLNSIAALLDARPPWLRSGF